ncbi:hypothetical protein H6P81_014305 [Aristolochia fimbriata]|uniref:Uncharacterized protein n=1 Tax=Aristolochia fimbriata TaxID=158543 RepID=A0AAV7EH70_ARIFI|nr:hypothetical protein H6P81_014305 [Aristolochia fimbriata]
MVVFRSGSPFYRIQRANAPFRSLSFLSIIGKVGSRLSLSAAALSSPRVAPATSRDLEFSDEQVKTELIHSKSTRLKEPASINEFETCTGSREKGKKPDLRGRVDRDESSAELGQQIISSADEINELKKKPRVPKEEVECLRENVISKDNVKCRKAGKKAAGLHSLFANRQRPDRKVPVPNDITFSRSTELRPSTQVANCREGHSPGVVMFVDALFKEGYLNDTSILQEEGLNFDHLSNARVQGSLKSAAERFGRDHQDIAKWLSGSQLKKVALFGCPSIERKTVFAAKTLRSFFSIQEDVVCRACKLRSSCKFVNQRVSKIEKLILEDALRVLLILGLHLLPQQLVLSDEVKSAIDNLLQESVQRSEYPCFHLNAGHPPSVKETGMRGFFIYTVLNFLVRGG